jgi:hypothetical protein
MRSKTLAALLVPVLVVQLALPTLRSRGKMVRNPSQVRVELRV